MCHCTVVINRFIVQFSRVFVSAACGNLPPLLREEVNFRLALPAGVPPPALPPSSATCASFSGDDLPLPTPCKSTNRTNRRRKPKRLSRAREREGASSSIGKPRKMTRLRCKRRSLSSTCAICPVPPQSDRLRRGWLMGT